jgi:hypothetical protein
MSQFTEKKAQNLIDTESIMQIDNTTYCVKSSTPGNAYIINHGICKCLGFKFRGMCSHTIAVEILQKQDNGTEVIPSSS